MDNFFKKVGSTMQVTPQLTNSGVTCHETIINCLFDYYKFVFPYSSSIEQKKETTFTNLYEEYKRNLPGTSDEEIFEMIKMDYPGIRPGIKYSINKNQLLEEDAVTGVWSLEKIKRTLEHWFCLDAFIPESSKQCINNSKGFKFLQTYTPGIFFSYEGNEQNFIHNGKEYYYKTCCLELKGEGCRKVEKNGVDLLKLLSEIYRIPGCHATRVDFATDLVNNKVITFEWLFKKILEEVSYQTTFKKFDLRLSFKIKTTPTGLNYNEPVGTTITFGSMESLSKMNIYDKKAERFHNAGVDVLTESWIRFEMQAFHEKADRLVKTLLVDIELKKFDEFCFSLLFKHLDIKINENIYDDVNYRPSRTRTWPTDPIWQEFMNKAGKLQIISQEKLEADFTRTRNWYERSVIPTQTFLDIFYEDSPISRIPILNKQIDFLENLDDKKLSILNQYRKDKLKCACDLTYKDIAEKRQKLIDERNELLKLCKYEE